MNNKLKLNIIISTINQALTMILPFVTAPYVSRTLGVEGIGIYSYTQSYVAIFSMFATLGTNSYGVREIARSRNDIKQRSHIFWEIEILSIFTSFLTIMLWLIWVTTNSKYRLLFGILTICLFGNMFDISWFFAGVEEFKYTVILNILFKFIGMFSIFFYVNKPEDLWKYVFILSMVIFGANVSLWLFLKKYICHVSIKQLKPLSHLKNTIVFFLPSIAVSIYTILDKTLIGIITNETSENGNYEQATKIVNMCKTLSFTGLNAVFQSRLAFLFSQNKHDEIIKNIAFSMEYIFFMGFGMCFGIIGMANRFVPLFFGAGYDKTIVLIKLLAPMIIIVGISNCLGAQYYIPAGFRSKSAKFIILGSVINLSLNISLIPYFKSVGAVISTIIAESIISLLYLINCNGYYSIKLLKEHTWKKLIAGIGMCMIIHHLGEIIDNTAVALISQFTLGLLTYIFILCILKDDALNYIKRFRKNNI
ncbi:MAG: oligosaccharide flippase family protein [Lachnospiraceae bacterium]|nr:oligosaccharide flippase family protein [Lachnospiraceae bacterium]